MKEIWKPIDEFEGYEISNLGRVRALERLVENNGGMQKKHARILTPSTNRGGYYLVQLSKDGKRYGRTVHRLVAMAFIPNPENKPVVDHIDTNKLNNSVENLKWATTQENALNPLTRLHNSESKKGHKPYLKEHSEESKEKMRQAKFGKKASDETRKKLSEMRKGKPLSEEHKKRVSESKMGHYVSEETKEKIRQAHLKRKEKNYALSSSKMV